MWSKAEQILQSKKVPVAVPAVKMPQPWQELSYKHRHPRDAEIQFDEPTHVYTVKGSSKGIISCTKFLHDFFPHFDADAVIRNMMRSPKWPQSKWYPMTAEQIKKAWNDNGAEASGSGTALHLAIEQVMHGHPELVLPEVRATPEWRYFENFWRDCGADLVPYRSEWEVWSEEYKLAGSIDMVFYRPSDGTYVIYDWKRSKEIKRTAFRDTDTGFGPLSHLPNCNYWTYTVQLNVYRWFLETYYGLKISDMYLVIMHPENSNYKRFKLNRLEEEVEGMLACRLEAVRQGCKVPVVLPAEKAEEVEEPKGACAPSGFAFLDD